MKFFAYILALVMALMLVMSPAALVEAQSSTPAPDATTADAGASTAGS